MAQKAEYQAIHSKNIGELNTQLAQMAIKGWKPLLITGIGTGGATVVILEHQLNQN